MIITIPPHFQDGASWMAPLSNGKAPGADGKFPGDAEYMEALPYAWRDGKPLLLDVVRPKGPRHTGLPVILYIHGGGWNSGTRQSIPDAFWHMPGYIRISVEYRLSGAAAFPAQLLDCQAALRWIRAHAGELGAHPDRIGVWGSSAGGHLACLLGLAGEDVPVDGEPHAGDSHRVQAVISCAGPADLPELWEWRASLSAFLSNKVKSGIGRLPQRLPVLLRRPAAALLNKLAGGLGNQLPLTNSLETLLGGSPGDCPEAWRQASPVFVASSLAESGGNPLQLPPFLLLHGTTDPLVPVYQAVKLHDALTGAGASVLFVPLPGHGHSTYWDHQGKFRQETILFIKHFLDDAL